jgi:hypothetical protein
MDEKMKNIFFVFFFFLCLAVSGCVSCESDDGSGYVQVTLKPDMEKILINEPLFITISFKNTYKKEVKFRQDISPICLVSYENEPFFEYGKIFKGRVENYSQRGFVKLAPDEEFIIADQFLFLYFHKNQKSIMYFVFRKSGKYKIQVKINESDITFKSNTVDIVVHEPDKMESEAGKIITDSEISAYISGFNFAEKNALRLLQVIEKYPKSAYTDYACYRLGEYYTIKAFRNREQKTDYEPSLRKALEMYLSVSDRNPALRIRSLYYICELSIRHDFGFSIKKVVDIDGILTELEKNSETVKSIGYQEKLRKTLDMLKRISENEMKSRE